MTEPAMNDRDALLRMVPATARLTSVRSGKSLDGDGLRPAVASRRSELPPGLSPGDRLVIGEADPLDFLVALFAAWSAGLVAVGVNPGLAAGEQQNVVSVTGAKAWLGEVRGPLDLATGAAGGMPANEAPALILMTSGTTGNPKGIVHSQQSLGRRIALNIEAIGVATLARSLCVLPVFFGHGLIGNVLTPLLAGGHVHLWPTPAASELGGLGPYLDAHGIGFMSSVPSFWRLALRMSPKPKSPLGRVHVGSAPLGLELWRQIADWAGTRAVFNMLGMTETANWISGGVLTDPEAGDGYVGRIWGGEFAVRGDDGTIRTQGTGEVLVRSPSIMLGYWRRPDLDAAAFVEGWFRTGDVGTLDAGRVTLRGRIKTEINRGGIKVQAEEIDMLLERHPDIAEACAFGIPDAVAGEAIAAAIVLRAQAAFAPEAIKDWCRQHARADAVPSRLYAVEAIPRNDRGKIVRSDVRRLVGAGE